MNAKKIHEMIATVLGVGYSPLAPGTAGSFAGLLLYMVLRGNTLVLILVFAALFTAGVVSSNAVSKAEGEKDPSKVVIDEFACMLVVYLFIPFSPVYIITGFLVYRFLDVVKLPPLAQLEYLPGGWGIMLDDLGAAVYTNIFLHILSIFI